jgi:hypothetical protein
VANEIIKIIDVQGGVDLQNEVDTWIGTLATDYTINSVAISQDGAALSSSRLIMAVAYLDGST